MARSGTARTLKTSTPGDEKKSTPWPISRWVVIAGHERLGSA